jgi:hypothetical protein
MQHQHVWAFSVIGDTLGDSWLYSRCTVTGCSEMVDCGQLLKSITVCPECGMQLTEGYCWSADCSQFNVCGDPLAFGAPLEGGAS